MLKFSFRKLVRDKIVDHQLNSGARPDYRVLALAEHKEMLIEKIIEESKEILSAQPKNLASEIADVQQALDDLKTLLKVSDEKVKRAQAAKKEKDGAFKKGLYIETVEVDQNDPWVNYFRDNIDRYPEVK